MQVCTSDLCHHAAVPLRPRSLPPSDFFATSNLTGFISPLFGLWLLFLFIHLLIPQPPAPMFIVLDPAASCQPQDKPPPQDYSSILEAGCPTVPSPFAHCRKQLLTVNISWLNEHTAKDFLKISPPSRSPASFQTSVIQITLHSDELNAGNLVAVHKQVSLLSGSHYQHLYEFLIFKYP